ncbi:MAG: ankyrin repeat domain-containing protein [Microthrixaceae bacterium]
MTTVSDERIQLALHALLSSDADGLRTALANDPALAPAAWNGNTLLEWATQPPHAIDRDCIAVLIESGAPLDRALGLAGCWNLDELCTQLLDAGADPTSYESDISPITPLESAAMHGSTAAADVLVEHGLHRPTLWLAAATGQVDLVAAWVSDDGTLLKPAGGYRPIWAHVGRPDAPAPTDDPAQILGEALTFAAANERFATVDHLLARGVPIDTAPYWGITSLHFAIQFGKKAMVKHLLDRGASTTAVDDEWNATPAKWAEVCADGSPERAAIIALFA